MLEFNQQFALITQARNSQSEAIRNSKALLSHGRWTKERSFSALWQRCGEKGRWRAEWREGADRLGCSSGGSASRARTAVITVNLVPVSFASIRFSPNTFITFTFYSICYLHSLFSLYINDCMLIIFECIVAETTQ